MEAAHIYSAQEILNRFGVSEREGLSDVQVREARQKYGRNGTV